MRKLFFILFVTITVQANSQSTIFIFELDNDCSEEIVKIDSTDTNAVLKKEIEDIKLQAWAILGMGFFSHGLSSMAFFDAESPGGFDHGVFIVHTFTAVSLDVVAIIRFFELRKKKKELEKIIVN